MVVAGRATVEVAIIVVLVFIVAVGCCGYLWVVVVDGGSGFAMGDSGSGLLRLMVVVSYGLLYLFY